MNKTLLFALINDVLYKESSDIIRVYSTPVLPVQSDEFHGLNPGYYHC